MSEADVEPGRNTLRFFCHRCNIEFDGVTQYDTCPYCSTGFIERLDTDDSFRSLEEGEYSDAEMSILDDAGGTDDSVLEDSLEGSNTNFNEIPPMLNDLAFLMTGGRTRTAGNRPPRQETLMEQLVWMIGGGRPGTGAVTAGAPFVLVGAPGDYVFGGEGLDAVVTQLLGQLENTGPPPLPTEQIATIPSEEITAAQVEANMSCSVCWDTFTLGETVSRLECTHIFHPACISPWLQLHATCPICRRSLVPPGAPAPEAPPQAPAQATPQAPGGVLADTSNADRGTTPSISRVVVRRVGAPRRRRAPAAETGDESSSTSSASMGGLWAQLASTISSLSNESSGSLNSQNSSDRYMDIDFD